MIMKTLMVREAIGSSENIENYYPGYRISNIQLKYKTFIFIGDTKGTVPKLKGKKQFLEDLKPKDLN